MKPRRGFLIGFGVVAAALLIVIGWQLYQMRDSCMNAASGGSCPALADVGEVRYTVSMFRDLVSLENDLTVHGEISQTNVPQMFDGLTVYALGDIDPAALLVARAREDFDPGDGPYRLLFRADGDRSDVWPALCDYLTSDRLLTQPECNVPA